jgi:hypothetical protein
MTNRRGQKQNLYCILLPRISSDNFRKYAVGQPVTWTTTSYPPCSCNTRPTATIIPFRLPTSSYLPAQGEISTVRKIKYFQPRCRNTEDICRANICVCNTNIYRLCIKHLSSTILFFLVCRNFTYVPALRETVFHFWCDSLRERGRRARAGIVWSHLHTGIWWREKERESETDRETSEDIAS